MNTINKIKIAQNEIEKLLSELSTELNLNEEEMILALELTNSKLYSQLNTVSAYKAYEEEKQSKLQDEFASNLQKEIENKEESN